MKRIFCAVLVICLPASAAVAGNWAVGLHGGSSVPDLRDNGGNELSRGWSSRVAPYFGATAEYEFSPEFSIQSGLDYAPQGGKKNGLQPIITDTSQLPVPPGTTLYADFKNVAKLNYLEIPVLATFHFGPSRQFSAGVGPYFGLLLSARNVTSGTSSIYLDAQGQQALTLPPDNSPLPPQSFDATTDGKSDLHSFNCGLQAALGVQHPVGGGFASLGVRGGLGLTNIQKDPVNGKNTTGNLVVAVGYSVRVGREGR